MAASDEQLVARVLAARDQSAFGELVARHQSRVRNWLRQLTRDPARADDLAQETFIAAWQKLAGFGGHGKFSSWLMKIAYNEFLQSHRESRRERQLAEAVAAETPTEPAEDPAMAEQAATDLERMLGALSAAERQAMVLCYAYGLSHAEASEITGMPIGTIKSHINRGKDRIRARFLVRRSEESPRHA
jgi:RNA polymerase sigma-70 factor (ECF subfamily)